MKTFVMVLGIQNTYYTMEFFNAVLRFRVIDIFLMHFIKSETFYNGFV